MYRINTSAMFDTLSKFASIHNLSYNNKPLPYRPYGEVRGVFKDYYMLIYILRTDTRAAGFLHTVFSIEKLYLLPDDFCIEYSGGMYNSRNAFSEIVTILSYDKNIVYKFLDSKKESDLMKIFRRIDEIDTSIFNIRSNLRIQKDGVTLKVKKIFEKLYQFNLAYYKVNSILIDLVLLIESWREQETMVKT